MSKQLKGSPSYLHIMDKTTAKTDETTVKTVKNEQWTILELIDKINKKEISKPKFQRKKNGIYNQRKKITQMKENILIFYM